MLIMFWTAFMVPTVTIACYIASDSMRARERARYLATLDA